MQTFGPEIATEVVAACQTAAEQISSSLSRAFDVKLSASIGPYGTYELGAAAAGILSIGGEDVSLQAAGLVIVLCVDRTAAIVLLPDDPGVSEWSKSHDASRESKLDALSQELGELVLPAGHALRASKVSAVEHVGQTLARAGVAAGAAVVPWRLSRDDGGAVTALLIWPAPRAEQLANAAESAKTPHAGSGEHSAPGFSETSAPASEAEMPEGAMSASTTDALGQIARPRRALRTDDLPPYTKSLLRIRVPVTVTLAQTKQQIGRILELGPGTIIQFDKSCEEMLDLEVGGHRIAHGEAVKIGDKFGIRLTSVIAPPERFSQVRTQG